MSAADARRRRWGTAFTYSIVLTLLVTVASAGDFTVTVPCLLLTGAVFARYVTLLLRCRDGEHQ